MDEFLGGAVRNSSSAYRLVLYRAERAEFVRTAGDVRRVAGDSYRFVVPIHGEMVVIREGRRTRLRPGKGGLLSFVAPLKVVQQRPARAFVLTIPAYEVDGRLRPVPPVVGLDLSTGLGRVVAGMIRAVGDEALTGPQFDAACDRITELLCIAVGEERPAAPGHLAEVEAVVRRYVREHATDPGLTGAAMAQDLGWSLRQIQLALQRAGTTPRELIREERLRLVRDRLRDPGDNVSITDLAHATGFSSASALSHAFRRRYGITPRDLRRHAVSR